MKKIFNILFAVFLVVNTLSFVNAASVERISPVDNSSLEIFLSDDVDLWDWVNVDADIKVLKDLIVSSAYKDTSDFKKVIINLTYDLQKNNTYSLLGIVGTDANADFEISDKISWEISIWTKEIDKINIVNEKTIEVYYVNEIEADEFVYKVLKNLNTKELSFRNGALSLIVESPLEVFSSYILLINSFSDSIWADIVFDEVYYEFQTPDYLEEVFKSAPVLEDDSTFEALWTPKEESDWNIEKVAMNSAKTPATWTATWILFLIAWLISGFFFIKFKRK